MSNLVELIKRPSNIWTVFIDGKDWVVELDETPLIVWRAFGLHPSGVVEITQSSKGHIERFNLVTTGEELHRLCFPKTHALYTAINLKKIYQPE